MYAALPEFQKSTDDESDGGCGFKANTTRAEIIVHQVTVMEGGFLEHFNFRAVFSMDYGSNNGRTYQPIIKVCINTVKMWLHWERVRRSEPVQGK